MLEPVAGQLLIATPLLDDPNFERAVVLIGEHGTAGTFGIILNRPLEIDIDEHFPQWTSHLAVPATLFNGGPVAPDVVLGLTSALSNEVPIGDELSLVNLVEPPSSGTGQVRLFKGHASWVGGQLAAELAAGAWFVVNSVSGDVFTSEPDLLWRNVLRRQADDLQLFTFYPRDITLN